MSNPLITRLGVNQFWHKHWYAKKNYANTLQQDKLIEKLVGLYLNYGLTTTSSPFIHEFWYRSAYRRLRVTGATDYSKFFRRFFYSNDVVGVEHSYLLRNRTGEYFPMKVWVFRYVGWFVMSIQWFKPLKGRNASKRVRREASQVSSATRRTKFPKKLKRFSIAAAYVKSRDISAPKEYTF